MVFLSICTALYQYVPQGDGELPIEEGDLVFILEKSTEDDWWKATKKASVEGKEDPVGLIPNNYVEEAHPTHNAKALYDYTRQTDEEISFSEDSPLSVYDTSDPDWTLVGLDGEYGFAPANYIEIIGGAADPKLPALLLSPRLPERNTDIEQPPTPDSPVSPPQSPAAALAGIMHNQANAMPPNAQRSTTFERSLPPSRSQYTPEDSDEEASAPPPPSLPQRPIPQQAPTPTIQYASPPSPEARGVPASPSYNQAQQNFNDSSVPTSPGGFHLYNINEMISALGKKKKMPTTLGINLATGVIMIAPEKSRDGSQQEWTAEKLTHYAIEGKHVFMELVRPSKSIDFHAGAKDTAVEIVAGLGELAGAARAEGLREVFDAGAGSGSGSRTGQRKGQILYEFKAQGDDEVTVAVGDEVVIVDDSKSEEWWMVRTLKDGKEGVVPSSYVEVSRTVSPLPTNVTGPDSGRSFVDQNRLDEERIAKEASKAAKKQGSSDVKGSEVGPGVTLPKRGSSLIGGHDNNNVPSQRSKRDSRSDGRSSSSSKSKPDSTKTRTWTDRSGSFKVEAQFIGLKDGKINLHKLNGVKIAVPVVKMAVEDLEYVERVTGVSLDEDKPLSDIRRRNQKPTNENDRKEQPRSPTVVSAGASIGQQPKPPEYDWFDFFLKCGVSPYQCERYASNFNRDSMDEGILPDVTPSVLRTLGLKEGDILRVMKFLDMKFGRSGSKSKLRNVVSEDDEEEGEAGVASPGGGLFSGPGGTLKNNTRKGRPAPAVQTNDIIDPKAFQQKGPGDEPKVDPPEKAPTPSNSVPPSTNKLVGGFDDDAWDVKPSKQTTNPSQPLPSTSAPSNNASSQSNLTGSLAELSLLSSPLQPTVVHQTDSQQAPQNQSSTQDYQAPPPQQLPASNFQQQQFPQSQFQQPIQQQPTGANPGFFAALNQQSTGVQSNFGSPNQLPVQNYNQQQGQTHAQFPLSPAPRQRPQAPQFQSPNSLLPPPPSRPYSAPQNVSSQSNFGPPPLQPQLTGAPNQEFAHNHPSLQGPSLNNLNQIRSQQQFNQQPSVQPQYTGFGQPGQNFGQYNNGITQQPNAFGQQQNLQQQATGILPSPIYLNGQQTGSPFADPRSNTQLGGFQPTPPAGFSSSFYNPLLPQQTGSINSILPPALQPQSTGVNGFNRPGFGQPPPSIPSIPQQQTLATLQPQKTGPAPPVRFGVTGDAKKLLPQATGRKANLSQATPDNPFGF